MMNPKVAELMRNHGIHKCLSEDCQHRIEHISKLIIEECIKVATEANSLEAAAMITMHFKLLKEAERKLIGYAEREEGYYPIYEAAKGQIVTHAFILCKYCEGQISTCMGPRHDAVCLSCYEKEPEQRW